MTIHNTIPFFVDAPWLQNRLGSVNLRVVQIGGETPYASMHIPGAVLVNNSEFTTLRDGIPGMRSDPDVLALLFGRLGIAPDTTVVAYDLSGGPDASRFVWTLLTMGHEGGASVLDGGLTVWLNEQRPTESRPPVIPPVRFIPRPNEAWEADREQTQAATRPDAKTQLLDTRTRNEYVGLTLRSPRGHLAGAIHLDWVETLTGRHDPRLLPQETLRARLTAIGLTDPNREVIVYCETAHRASQTWVMLRHLGWHKVRMYDGSMAEWRQYDLPVVYGDNPR